MLNPHGESEEFSIEGVSLADGHPCLPATDTSRLYIASSNRLRRPRSSTIPGHNKGARDGQSIGVKLGDAASSFLSFLRIGRPRSKRVGELGRVQVLQAIARLRLGVKSLKRLR